MQSNQSGKRETFQPPWLKKAQEKSKIAEKPKTTVASPLKNEPKPKPKLNTVAQKVPKGGDDGQKTTEKLGTSKPGILKSTPPPPPPAPNLPPPPPPIAGVNKPKDLITISSNQRNKVEQLKSRPRRRPDWATMMKEIEEIEKKQLRHVVCNDRSSPILTAAKVEDQFVFESEKDASHKVLLKEIEQGRRLRPTKTNDRSKPNLEGLRKFRRQMTIEEIIQKSQSKTSIPTEGDADDAEELDDIDKVRDDLQSTKQLLALELRSKEIQQRENSKLEAEIQNLKAELEDAKHGAGTGKRNESNEKLITGLKLETMEAKRVADDYEKRYQAIADKMDAMKNEMTQLRRQNQTLERKIEAYDKKTEYSSPILSRQGSIHRQLPSSSNLTKLAEQQQDDNNNGDDVNEEFNIDDMSEEQKIRYFENKELKLLKQKLQSTKDKESSLVKDKKSLKEQIKNNTELIRDEKTHYRKLQKEVRKVESALKDEDDNAEMEASDSSSGEEEEESESSTDDDNDDESSDSEPESAAFGKRKNNYYKRTKAHETKLDGLKKSNSHLKTRLDRIIDQLSKQKEMSLALKEELDSFLEELG